MPQSREGDMTNPRTADRMTEVLMGPDGALHHLSRRDADIAHALSQYGPPPDRTMPQGFTTLIRTIIGQQISRHAATSVWQKMIAAGLEHPQPIYEAGVEALKHHGLSKQKAEYIHGIASAVACGDLDFDHLATLPGDEVSMALTRLRGVGDWTADNYRLFALLDMDAWPYNDLALQEGMKILKSLNDRPNAKIMQDMAELWRPCRGAGALMLWHIYAHHRRDASPASI
jgi:DNA-3-methyladenine glycosylase II